MEENKKKYLGSIRADVWFDSDNNYTFVPFSPINENNSVIRLSNKEYDSLIRAVNELIKVID